MKDTPIPFDIVKQKIEASKFSKVGRATIREIVQLVNEIEVATNIKFVRMEMGVPGLEPSKLGIEAEVEALRKGVARIYPMVDGLPELKKEMARFVKNFMNIDVAEKCCIPTVGSTQGGKAAFLL